MNFKYKFEIYRQNKLRKNLDNLDILIDVKKSL